jgi:hypothetical protein
MPSDPQNKAERPDGNVVALHRAELVASIERKLSEARRFFSLHDYASCEELVQEVLAADPQNSKARALLDLSSIKLSKRKLYKKIAEPQSSALQPSGLDLRNAAPTRPAPVGPRDPQTTVDKSRTRPDHSTPSPPTTPSVVIEPPPRRRRGLADSSAGSPQDSIRERTISALVDLLKNKETTIQDWKGGDPQAEITSPMPPSPAVPPSESVVPATIEEPTSLRAGGPPSPHGQHQASAHAPEQPKPTALETNRDFLPGTLDELFAEKPAKPVPPHRSESPLPVAPTRVVPQKAIPTPPAPVSLQERPAEPTKTSQEMLSVTPIPKPKLPEVSLPPAAFVSPPPVKKKEPSEKALDSSPVAPLPKPQTSLPAKLPSLRGPHVIQLPHIRIFDQITAPRPLGYQEDVERKIEQRSDELKNSEIQAGAIAQIKKYLYQEEYDLCARDLTRIRDLFPQNPEIQAFVENTSKRLVELQRIKRFEVQARDLMTSAVAFYQEGKREEALIAVREILRVNPNHVQAREFVSFVERHQGKDRNKQPAIQKVRACRSCGSEVDAVSQFCYHCGKKL